MIRTALDTCIMTNLIQRFSTRLTLVKADHIEKWRQSGPYDEWRQSRPSEKRRKSSPYDEWRHHSLDPLRKDVNLVLMMNDVSLVSLRNDVSHLEADIPRQKSVTNPKITHHIWRSAAAVNRGSIKTQWCYIHGEVWVAAPVVIDINWSWVNMSTECFIVSSSWILYLQRRGKVSAGSDREA